jgi:hypothetical protein
MNSLKDFGSRVIYFVMGLIIAVSGVVLLILEIFPGNGDQWYC